MFMRPNVVQDTFVKVYPPGDHGDSYLMPLEHDSSNRGKRLKGFFSRLSAPGYLDCTDWSGPFDTKEEALEHLFDMYGTDDETIEQWEEEAF